LSFRETRELEALPGRIAVLEAEQKAIGERLADPALYRERASEVGPLQARFDAIEGELLELLARWEVLFETEAQPEAMRPSGSADARG